MDHISDSFLETNVPLLVLIEAAKSGNEKEVKEYAQVFREHANKLVEVSVKRYAGSHTEAHMYTLTLSSFKSPEHRFVAHERHVDARL